MPSASAPPPSGRFAHAGILALTVLVFAAVVALVSLQLRAGLRDQILTEEAEKIAAVASMQLDNSAADMDNLPFGEVPGALLIAVLKTSKLAGVAGVRVFDAQGRFNSAWPINWSEELPEAADWLRLTNGELIARVHQDLTADEVIGLGSARRGLVETWVPLRPTGTATMIGAAQFWVDGDRLSTVLARHDRRLWVQAAIAWLAGSGVIVFGLSWAFQRLDVANRELRVRSDDLQRANSELVLAAKTTALGTVAAHLMHELKNPIAGLETLVRRTDGNATAKAGGGGELEAASELTKRLRTMVNDVVGVLRDEQTGAKFELSGAEIAEVVAAKIHSDAAQRQIRVETSGPAGVSLPARRANIATLVLRNLLQNGLEATPAGGTIRLSGSVRTGGAMEFQVEDGGTGLPDAVRQRLFQPCTSTKVGGSGLGLALSHQLAQQAGGRLELVRSDERGTCFRLVLAAEA